MLYLTGVVPTSADTCAALRSTGRVGVLDTHRRRRAASELDGWTWAADNGCFTDAWRSDVWVDWLVERSPLQGSCLFAAVPDVVSDHAATLDRWHEWSPLVRDLGYPPAFVIQDGCTPAAVPWDECGAVFLGGTTAFKLSPAAEAVLREARVRGVWAHVGRVNSLRRLRWAADMGARSADGTFLAWAPDARAPRLLAWARALDTTPSLFA